MTARKVARPVEGRARIMVACGVGNTLTVLVRSLKRRPLVKYWESIADNLSKAGWSWGYVSGVDSNWRTIFVADAHRGDGQRFVVRADERLTAFLELESVIRAKHQSIGHRVLLGVE